VLIYAIPIVLAIWALVDLIQTPRAAVRWMAKPFWFIAVVGLPIAGPVAWLIFGATRSSGRGPGGTPRRPRPIAPDDDPDFLRGL
jgi:hypothetical protein